MATRNPEPVQANKGVPQVPDPPLLPSPAEQLRTRVCNTVFKTGPLFISSKGIGWTSWKKRWFILTRTSLVFFRSDPSAIPQKGSEVNLTLGGIDLNNTGSVVIKEDKKLLTVLFPDGRDGRTFTLKAETTEDLQEWKTALENALAQAPNHPMGQNGIFRNDQIDSVDGSLDQSIDRCPLKVPVIGRPVLLALEDVDGSPSFLEKALQYIEEYGVKVEGILRQAADVEDVERRIREYEQGKNDFSSGEDAHVIGDCIKYVLRELPSSPVPASSCKALLQACRTERSIRVNAMRTAICETFPEPNRRLLQRVLMMMQKVASHKAENRMSCSAVAACMAPLLLRPLLAGDCEIENDFDLGGDGSAQLLQAAAAANHAQAIVITLLDEYDKIFGEGSVLPEPYTDSEESGSGSDKATDDESYEDDEDDDSSQGSYQGADDDLKNALSETCSESGDSGDNSPSDDKNCAGSTSESGSDSPEVDNDDRPKQNISTSREIPIENVLTQKNINSAALPVNVSAEVLRDTSAGARSVPKSFRHGVPLGVHKSTTISNRPVHSVRNRSAWGRTAGRKNLSMESIDYCVDHEVEIQRLEVTKSNLENRIAEEVKENAVLQTNLEIRKKDLHHRRLALEQDVARLQEQLKKERDLRAALEAGLNMAHGPLPDLATIDEKTKAELEEVAAVQADVVNLTEKVGELGVQLNQQHELYHGSVPKLGVVPYKTWGHQNKTHEYIKDQQKDTDISPPHFERSRNKDFGGAEIENKYLSQNQQQDPLCSVSYRSIGVSADSSTDQSVISKRANSRRSFTKNEGTFSTNSALTKLTTRLNFLKERRTQIADELQNMDKNLVFSAISQTLGKGRELLQNADKGQGSEVQATQNPEKGRESDSYDLFQNLDRGAGTEGQALQNPDSIRKAESHSLNYADRGKRSDVQNSHGLDRGKSDNHLSLSVGKGRVVEGGHPFNSSKTNNR